MFFHKISLFIFRWVIPTLIRGQKKVLELSDLQPGPYNSIQHVGEQVWMHWQNERKREIPSLFRALLKVFGLRVFIATFLFVLRDAILRYYSLGHRK